MAVTGTTGFGTSITPEMRAISDRLKARVAAGTQPGAVGLKPAAMPVVTPGVLPGPAGGQTMTGAALAPYLGGPTGYDGGMTAPFNPAPGQPTHVADQPVSHLFAGAPPSGAMSWLFGGLPGTQYANQPAIAPQPAAAAAPAAAGAGQPNAFGLIDRRDPAKVAAAAAARAALSNSRPMGG